MKCPYCKLEGITPISEAKFSPASMEQEESFPDHWYQVFEHLDCKSQIRPRWTYDVTDINTGTLPGGEK